MIGYRMRIIITVSKYDILSRKYMRRYLVPNSKMHLDVVYLYFIQRIHYETRLVIYEIIFVIIVVQTVAIICTKLSGYI